MTYYRIGQRQGNAPVSSGFVLPCSSKMLASMDMRREKTICFQLLGTFSYAMREREKDSVEGEKEYRLYHAAPGKAGKKTLSFLQYLVVNHARNITAEELIDVFWAGESSDPANALRNMLFKIRGLLREMFPGEDDLLQTFPGCYAWNTEIEIELDAEQFEKVCLKARRSSGEKSVGLLCQAVTLYRGDFLSANDSEWAKTLRQYYRTLYLDVCRALLPVLEEKEEWMEIVNVCSQAYQIDFGIEDFTAYQMQAFIAMGQPDQAIERYETFGKRMLEEFGMPPTDRIEQIHALAQSLRKENMGNDEEIFKLVCEDVREPCPFFCNFGTFKSIVALEKRHLERSGQSSTLVIVSLGKGEASAADRKRLERILIEGLRTGDPVARLEAGSYILILTGTDMVSAQAVTGRLDNAFHKTYRHSKAQLTFSISRLGPDRAKMEKIQK